MMKFLWLVVAVFLAFFYPVPTFAGGEGISIVAKSEKYDIAFYLPDRWKHSAEDSGENDGSLNIIIADKEKVAYVDFYAETHGDSEVTSYDSAREWNLAVLKGLRDKEKGKWYNDGFGATEDETKRQTSTVTLGSGETATVIRAELEINENKRQVALIFFERKADGARQWFSIFVANQGKYADIGDSLKTIIAGIKFLGGQ